MNQKTIKTNDLNRFAFFIAMAAAFWLIGCSTSKTDPLDGWMFRPFPGWGADPNGHNGNKLDQSIISDYQSFIKSNNLTLATAIRGFFENAGGQHAVEFEAFQPHENATWAYALIYDKDNNRIKAIKYGHHRYQS